MRTEEDGQNNTYAADEKDEEFEPTLHVPATPRIGR
jgi:hypothetical protein